MIHKGLQQIKDHYEGEFKDGSLMFPYEESRPAITYKHLYPSGWRYMTITVLFDGRYFMNLTVGNLGGTEELYRTPEEVIEGIQFLF